MKNQTRNDMPYGACPHCGHKWQMDDWYELRGGDAIYCPKCSNEIHITDREDTCMMIFAKPKEVEG
jgi:DNA-directed RNA polymerase subunit RPC12/RpoP